MVPSPPPLLNAPGNSYNTFCSVDLHYHACLDYRGWSCHYGAGSCSHCLSGEIQVLRNMFGLETSSRSIILVFRRRGWYMFGRSRPKHLLVLLQTISWSILVNIKCSICWQCFDDWDFTGFKISIPMCKYMPEKWNGSRSATGKNLMNVRMIHLLGYHVENQWWHLLQSILWMILPKY